MTACAWSGAPRRPTVLAEAKARAASRGGASAQRLAAGELGLDIYDMREKLAAKGLKYV